MISKKKNYNLFFAIENAALAFLRRVLKNLTSFPLK
jgi:hypothetical protein